VAARRGRGARRASSGRAAAAVIEMMFNSRLFGVFTPFAFS
jgi:hypothetical protein